MRKGNLTALLLGAALFTGMGITSASAESMKCGAGKCGDAKPAKTVAKCGAEKKVEKCGAEKKAEKCGAEKKAAKCGAEKKVEKCGANK